MPRPSSSAAPGAPAGGAPEDPVERCPVHGASAAAEGAPRAASAQGKAIHFSSRTATSSGSGRRRGRGRPRAAANERLASLIARRGRPPTPSMTRPSPSPRYPSHCGRHCRLDRGGSRLGARGPPPLATHSVRCTRLRHPGEACMFALARSEGPSAVKRASMSPRAWARARPELADLLRDLAGEVITRAPRPRRAPSSWRAPEYVPDAVGIGPFGVGRSPGRRSRAAPMASAISARASWVRSYMRAHAEETCAAAGGWIRTLLVRVAAPSRSRRRCYPDERPAVSRRPHPPCP